jgi:D-2-hydroxyacid dehydrogenase (NADP+)
MLNVVTAVPKRNISVANQQKIRNVSPDVNLQNATLWVCEEMEGNLSHLKELDAMLGQADVLLARALPHNLIKRAPKLKWVQVTFAGMESVLIDNDLVKSAVKLTNSSGIQAAAIGEYVITLMLAFDKHLTAFAEQKKQKIWEPASMVGFSSQTVGILGLGSIGREIAVRARALGMHVIAYDRPRKLMRAKNVDKLVAGNDIDQLLKESDFVVSCLPFAPKTIGIIGEKELRMMKPTAYLINVSRGQIVQEEALIRALKEKWIAGAGLDVFVREPLPVDNPLWDLPNVIISPHCSGYLEDNTDRVVDLFAVNLKRYIDGKRLLNIVDKKAGF